MALMWAQVVQEIRGHGARRDEVGSGSGGAGIARLTAWNGLTLLVLVIAQLLTLFDTTGLIDWHIAIGAALIPYALLKSASTSWRMVGYYAGRHPFRPAGPPPMALRIPGPFVIFSALAVLASGVTLILLGESLAAVRATPSADPRPHSPATATRKTGRNSGACEPGLETAPAA